MILSCSYVTLIFTTSTLAFVSVKSKDLTILGSKLRTAFENNEYVAFYDIPYARPAVNERRFKPPGEYKPISNYGIHDYRKAHRETKRNIEDCLYLSIFRPISNNKTENFPVLVWTNELANEHGPDFFIDEKVLVVTVSFRSSIFGFLNTEDDFAEGNMGAKDMLTALKWLRDNISLFNGDPNRVTIIGSGIAATVVASMLLSVSADDLFRRAVIIDGSALSPADYRPYNFEVSNKLYWKLKGRYNKFNRTQLYDLLLSSSTETLLGCTNLYDSTEIRDTQRLINTFSCGIEKSSKKAFMNKSPLTVYDRKFANNNVEVIFGYSTLYSLYKLKGLAKNRKLLIYLNYNFQYLLPFEGRPDKYNSKRFSYKGSLNIGWQSSVPNLEWSGATLGDEICYLFKCKSGADSYKSLKASDERLFIRKIVRLFGNFAKYGNPTPNRSDNDNILGTLVWTPVRGNEKLQAMNLGRHFKMIDVPEYERKFFWDQLKNEYFQDY
ncbi:unnamed protein product, partial [Brenthis ino]